MICGIGTDLVDIQRIAAKLERHGRKFAERILTTQELASFDQSAHGAAFLAKRFAAKEAFAKALGTGFRDGLSLQHIRICNNDLGRPEILVTHRAEELLAGARVNLSLADETHYALAFVIIETHST